MTDTIPTTSVSLGGVQRAALFIAAGGALVSGIASIGRLVFMRAPAQMMPMQVPAAAVSQTAKKEEPKKEEPKKEG